MWVIDFGGKIRLEQSSKAGFEVGLINRYIQNVTKSTIISLV